MGDYSEEQLRNMHPQRSTYEFIMNKNKVVITSNFDAGNMARCEQMESGNNVSHTVEILIFLSYSSISGSLVTLCLTTNILVLGKLYNDYYLNFKS